MGIRTNAPKTPPLGNYSANMMLSPCYYALVDLADDAWTPNPAMILGQPPLAYLPLGLGRYLNDVSISIKGAYKSFADKEIQTKGVGGIKFQKFADII